MKKRLIKKFGDDWCFYCNRPMKIYWKLTENNPYIGYFETKGKYPYCPKCKCGRISGTLGVDQEKEFSRIASELLLKNYPPDKYEYLSEEEVFQEERADFDDFESTIYRSEEGYLRHLRYFVFNTFWNGKRIYLKKSYEIYKEKGKGWFDITKPESEMKK